MIKINTNSWFYSLDHRQLCKASPRLFGESASLSSAIPLPHQIRVLSRSISCLGMTRHFFSEGAQERFAQSRFDTILELGRIAEEDSWFMVACGDVFESNPVDRKTVSRATEALKDVSVSVIDAAKAVST